MDHSFDNEEALRTLLRQWKVESPLPPRFQEGVWRRIQHETAGPVIAASPWTILRHWIAHALPRPALAASYLVILLAAGAGAGWTMARHESSRVSVELRMRYVNSVDPYPALW